MAKSKAAWVNLDKTLAVLETQLSSGTASTYLCGDQISLADLHAGAYVARVLAVAGADKLDAPSAVAKLNPNLQEPVGPKVTAWLGALFERKSFAEAYTAGLH